MNDSVHPEKGNLDENYPAKGRAWKMIYGQTKDTVGDRILTVVCMDLTKISESSSLHLLQLTLN